MENFRKKPGERSGAVLAEILSPGFFRKFSTKGPFFINDSYSKLIELKDGTFRISIGRLEKKSAILAHKGPFLADFFSSRPIEILKVPY